MRLVEALAALAALAACSHSSPTRTVAKRGCVADVGCKPTAAIPVCTADQLGAAQGAATAVRRLVQADGPSRVEVFAPLVKARTMCTLLDCGGGCCNSCGGFLALSLGESTGYADNANRLLLMGDGISCSGDDSGICCTHEVGTVVARIELKVHGSYSTALYGPSYHGTNAEILCSVPSGAKLEKAAPLRVAVPQLACSGAKSEDPIAQLSAGDVESIGAFAQNEIGCTSVAIIEAGMASRPALEKLLDSSVPLDYGDGKVRTVGDAAAFLLSQICQVPRYMAGGTSSARDRKRFVESVAKHCR